MKKLYEAKVPLSAFAGKDGTDEDKQKALDFFGVTDINSVVQVSLKLENFLWPIFMTIQPPASPLKVKAHERFLNEVAAKLNLTVDSDTELPKLNEAEKKAILPFLEDEEKYKVIEGQFEAKIGDGEVKVINLPLVNILNNLEFVNTIAEVMEQENVNQA